MKTLEKTIWDYQIRRKDLENPKVLRWYLERKINFGDWTGIKEKDLKNNLSKLAIEPEIKKILEKYFLQNGKRIVR